MLENIMSENKCNKIRDYSTIIRLKHITPIEKGRLLYKNPAKEIYKSFNTDRSVGVEAAYEYLKSKKRSGRTIDYCFYFVSGLMILSVATMAVYIIGKYL